MSRAVRLGKLLVIPKRNVPDPYPLILPMEMSTAELVDLFNSDNIAKLAIDRYLLSQRVEALRVAAQRLLPSDVANILSALTRLKSLGASPTHYKQLYYSLLRRCQLISHGFTLDEASVVVSFLCEHDSHSKPVIAKMCEILIREAANAKPQNLIPFFVIFARLKIDWRSSDIFTAAIAAGAESFPRLVGQMSPYELASALNALTQVGIRHDRTLEVAAKVAAASIASGNWSGRDISLVLNSYAVAERRPLALLRASADFAKLEICTFEPQSIALFFNAMAKCDFQVPEVAEAAVEKISREIDNFEPQGVAMIMHAFSTFGVTPEVLTNPILHYSTRKISNFSTQGITMLLTGMNRANLRIEKFPGFLTALRTDLLFRLVCERNPRRRFSASEICALSKSLSGLRIKEPRIWDAMFLRLRTSKDEIDDHGLVTFISTASRIVDAEPLRRWGSDRIRGAADRVATSDLTQLWEASARLGVVNKMTFSALGRSAEKRLENFSVKNLAKILNLGAQTLPPGVIFRGLKIFHLQIDSADLIDLAETLGAVEISRLRDKVGPLLLPVAVQRMRQESPPLNAFCKIFKAAVGLRLDNPEFFSFAGKFIFEEEGIKDGGVLKSMAVADSVGLLKLSDYPGTPDLLISSIIDRVPADCENLAWFGLWLFACKKCIFMNIPKSAREKLSSAISKTRPLPKISFLHREISRFLTLAGFDHRNAVAFGPLTVDIAQGAFAIEVDGPAHFFDGATRTGESVLKGKIIEGLGMRVLHVTQEQWRSLGKSEDVKYAFACQLRAAMQPRLET